MIVFCVADKLTGAAVKDLNDAQGRRGRVQVVDKLCHVRDVGFRHQQTDTPQGIRIKRRDTYHGFILKYKRNIFFFQKELENEIFMWIGKCRNQDKILHV